MTITRRATAAIAAATVLATAACAPLDEEGPEAAEGAEETTQVEAGGSISIAAVSPMTDWNPLSAAGDTTGQRQQQWPLYPHPFLTLPDTSVVMNEALLVSDEVTIEALMVVEYVILPVARWCDGTPITGADFECTQAVQDLAQCEVCFAAFTAGYSDIAEI